MPSQSLKDLAVQIQELSFRDMVQLSEALTIASYHSGVARAEKILNWAEGVTAPPVPVEPLNEVLIFGGAVPPFEPATERKAQ